MWKGLCAGGDELRSGYVQYVQGIQPTISRQTSKLYLSSLIFEHILRPQWYNSRILEYLTEILSMIYYYELDND